MSGVILKQRSPVGVFRTVRRALTWLGKPDARRYHQVHPQIKRLMVLARRAGEDDTAAELSQLSAFLKKKMYRGCPACDATLSKSHHATTHCDIHRVKRGRHSPVALRARRDTIRL